MMAPASSATPHRTWLGRARLVAAVLIVWGGLHYVCEAAVMPRGLDRPLVVIGGPSAWLAAPLAVALICLGSFVGAHVAGARRPLVAPLVVGLALAAWAWSGGTMDDWLKLRLEQPDMSAAVAYWPLMIEYVIWLVSVSAALAAGELAALGRRLGDAPARRAALRRAFCLDADAAELRRGVLAMLLTAVVAGVLLLYLTGPRVTWTRRGQVYFAVAVAFLAGVYVARRVLGAGRPLWFALAPFAVGLTGVTWAALRPTLPEPYQHINVIPVSGLVRPLPVEMVGVALVIVAATARPSAPTAGPVRTP